MPRKPVAEAPKANPLQVRLDPHVLARVRELAGPGGASEWVRQAVDAALARLDQPSLGQLAQEPAQPAPTLQHFEVDQLLTRVAALADTTTASSFAATKRDESMAKQLASVQATAEQLGGLVRQVAGVITLLARPLGVPEQEIGRLLLTLQQKPAACK